jgi:hypothetical protein
MVVDRFAYSGQYLIGRIEKGRYRRGVAAAATDVGVAALAVVGTVATLRVLPWSFLWP